MAKVSPDAIHLFFITAGSLQFLFLLQLLPHARRLFLSERYGGYGDDRRLTRVLQSPLALVIGCTVWSLGCLGLIAGRHTLASAVALVTIAQYIFIRQRWRSISRGCGAPGFISYWIALATAVLAAGHYFSQTVVDVAASILVLDFALIFLVAGLYKFASGYRHDHGVFIGLVNPQWSYAPRFWSRQARHRWAFRLLDTYAWFGEIIGALLILVPATRSLGAIVIAVMFIALIPLIRLGLLTVMVLLQCFLVILVSTDPLGRAIQRALGLSAAPPLEFAPGTSDVIALILLGILTVALLVGYSGLLLNFYAGWRPRGPLQWVLDRIANSLGLILWRVFTADVTGFYIDIRARSRTAATERRISNWSAFGFSRFQEVTEAITVTSIFTARRYFPHDLTIFGSRLRRYARTLPINDEDEVLDFRYWRISLAAGHVTIDSPVLFTVDRRTGRITSDDSAGDPSVQPAPHSVVRPSERPGTYRRVPG